MPSTIMSNAAAEPPTSESRYAAVDAETMQVLKGRVSDGSRENYESTNVKFLVWIYDNQEDHGGLLKSSLLREMETAHETDGARRTAAGRPSKLRDTLRAVCRRWLKAITPSDPETHPVELADLTFTIFARYLATFKKRVQNKRMREEGEAATILIRLGSSAFDRACSSLSHLYLECRLDKEAVSKDLWAQLSTYKKGSRRAGAKERKKLGLTTVEGKKHLPFMGYRLLAKLLFESDHPEHVYAHTFLIIDWNLMSRSETVIDSKIDLVAFEKDALLFDMGVTKTDQDGTRNVDHPWHVYGCLEYPEICAQLSFARLIMANPLILNGRTELFEGESQYDRFYSIFRGIVGCNEWRGTFAALGITPEDFGTHSIRKGAATHVATGSTACPPIASICLRANWAMPGVLNRYIKYENAGDQFVGKCVSGRSRKSKEFAASPPYWDFSTEEREEKEACEHRLHGWLRDHLPEEAKDNLKVFAVYKMSMANIVHHREYLEEHLHQDCILRYSSFWAGVDDIPFPEKVVVKYPWNATCDTPEITGIPPDIVLLAEMEALQLQMRELKDELKSSFKSTLIEQLDEREVGGSGFARGNEILEKVEALLEKVSQVSATAQVPAVCAPTVCDDPVDFEHGDGCVSENEEQDIVLALDEPARMTPNKRARIIKQTTKEQIASRKIKVGFHHGHFNPLPASWKIPKGLTVIQLVNLWLVGSEKEHVPPLRKIPRGLLQHIDKGSRMRSQMKTVMGEVEYFARRDDVWLDRGWTGVAVTKMWSTIWPRLDPHLRTQTTRSDGGISEAKSRQGQISWRTLYNKLMKDGKNWLPSKVARNADSRGRVEG
jgi:hypothetical protein